MVTPNALFPGARASSLPGGALQRSSSYRSLSPPRRLQGGTPPSRRLLGGLGSPPAAGVPARALAAARTAAITRPAGPGRREASGFLRGGGAAEGSDSWNRRARGPLGAPRSPLLSQLVCKRPGRGARAEWECGRAGRGRVVAGVTLRRPANAGTLLEDWTPSRPAALFATPGAARKVGRRAGMPVSRWVWRSHRSPMAGGVEGSPGQGGGEGECLAGGLTLVV